MPIHTIDAHPFFLRVLERFRGTDTLPDSLFLAWEEGGAKVAVAIAQRHYNSTREADIIRCVDILLGVCSLALYDMAKGNPDTATKILPGQDIPSLFRHGWTLIHALAKEEVEFEVTIRREHADTAHELDILCTRREKALLEQCAVTNGGRVWNGHREYRQRLHEIREAQRTAGFSLWLERAYYRTRDETELAPRPDTLFASLALNKQPHAPLAVREVEQFFSAIATDPKGCERGIRERSACILNNVPKEWRSEWQSLEQRFFARCLPTIRNYVLEGAEGKAFEYAMEYAFFVTP